MKSLIIVITILAVFRLAVLFSEEEGPLAAFSLMRRKVPRKTNLGRGIRCFNCWSVWLALAASGYLWSIGLVDLALLPFCIFAVSGGAVLLNRWSDK